tara:strand:+ start:123 stop:344 length:222 start_codon:yes stop_codon:yes gene_type:complete
LRNNAIGGNLIKQIRMVKQMMDKIINVLKSPHILYGGSVFVTTAAEAAVAAAGGLKSILLSHDKMNSSSYVPE